MTFGTFSWLAAILGVALVLLLQFIGTGRRRKQPEINNRNSKEAVCRGKSALNTAFFTIFWLH